MDATQPSRKARVLAAAVEPFAAQVYFSPECHALYEAMGFGASRGVANGVALPDGPAYFCSRGSVLGQVPGELVASAFAVFNPAVVVPAVTHGWTLTDAATIEKARTAGAVGQLTRILGPGPDGIERLAKLLVQSTTGLRLEGKPLYAGVTAQQIPDGSLGAAWRLADRLREYRGDAHTAAWTTAGFDAVEIGLLTELFGGLPLKSYVRTRAWSDAELDEGIERLVARGLLADGALTEAGRAEREAVEAATDRQCQPILDAIGDDFAELIEILTPYGTAIRAAGGYLPSLRDLADAASKVR